MELKVIHWQTSAVHHLFHLGGNVVSSSRKHGCPAVVHSRACSPRKFLIILGVLRHILVHLRHTEKHTELLEKRFIIIIIIVC